jgi:hypothetical protein
MRFTWPRSVLQLEEEACIQSTSMQHRGMLTFCFHDNPQPWQVHGETPAPLLGGSLPRCLLAAPTRSHPLCGGHSCWLCAAAAAVNFLCGGCGRGCAVFCVAAFRGEPGVTDEMEPLWFSPDSIPFDQSECLLAGNCEGF